MNPYVTIEGGPICAHAAQIYREDIDDAFKRAVAQSESGELDLNQLRAAYRVAARTLWQTHGIGTVCFKHAYDAVAKDGKYSCERIRMERNHRRNAAHVTINRTWET